MPQKFILEITLGNEEMNTGFEVCRAIEQIHNTMDGYSLAELTSRGIMPIRDINGNVVGHYEVIE